VETGYFSLQGLERHVETIRQAKGGYGTGLTVRVLVNGYDVRTKLAREILSEMRHKHEDLMLKSYINFNTKLREGASVGQPITEYDSASMGCRDFVRLAGEIVELERPTPVHEELIDQAQQLADRAETLLAGRSPLLAISAVEMKRASLERHSAARPPAAVSSAERSSTLSSDEASPTMPGKTGDGIAHERILQRIDEIYGVRQTALGAEFNANLPGAKDVLIAGDFNNWSPSDTPMLREGENGHFRAIVALPKGRYRYRLLVDGRWTCDPCNEQTELNEAGELTSIVQIH
jgi:hypothetical protein